jgi:hypothetical protein
MSTEIVPKRDNTHARAVRRRPGGQVSIYTPEIATEICSRMARGETLRGMCRDKRMPCAETVRQWVIEDREGFAGMYARARDLGLDNMAEEMIAIADDASGDVKVDAEGRPYVDHEHINRSRLRIDARKWFLGKLAPKKYGAPAEALPAPEPDDIKVVITLFGEPGRDGDDAKLVNPPPPKALPR